jgi:dipeptidyl aminopeptidase/acylaminoacyl peptidase
MRTLRTLLVFLLAFSFIACASGPQPAPEAAETAAGVPLIPRAVLFDNPERSSAQLSPDGTRLSYLAPVDGVLNIWVQTPGQDDAKPVTSDKKRGVRIYFWTEDSKYLIYLQDQGGDENWQVHQVKPETAEDKILTPFEEVRSGIVALSKRKPDEMLIQMNRRNKTLFDVYRVNLISGKLDVDTLNPGHVMMWLADEDLAVRAAVAFDEEGQTLLLVRDTVKDKWRLLRSWTPLEEGGAVTFSADGKSLIVAGNKDTDTKRLYSMEIKTGKITEIYHDPQADFVDGLIHPDDKVVEAVANERLRKKWTVLNKRVEKDFEILRQLGQDDFQVVSRTRDDQKWIVAVTKDVRGVVYYLYDRKAGKTDHLFDARPKLKDYQLAPMKPMTIKSRDGLELVSYLTVPLQAEAGKKLPMVLLVHGGPWWRDFWGYDPETQWLANRGYAVLQVNFRGSDGFGKKFLNAGNKEWGRKMQDDLTDAVGWAIDNANADPVKVGIMGGSYGGYATLAGVTFTPDLYAAAVDIVGPSNIITLLETVPPYWKPIMCIFKNRVGDKESEKKMLEERSPLNYADKIKTPLFIFQGANDPRVKQAESDRIVKAIRDRGGSVDYVVYTDEGHGFARPPNRMDYIGRTEQFLKEYLGGRSEPHKPPEGTTAQVK